MDEAFKEQRYKDSLGARFRPLKESGSKPEDVLILTAASDQGVIRNLGRRGGQWGPKALLATLAKMVAPTSLEKDFLSLQEVASSALEEKDFSQGQILETQQIASALKRDESFKILHLGGGHDHIYPLLSAIKDSDLVVVNIDAHADTRLDGESHSGNPFRKFSEKTKKDFKLFQIGLHPFANAQSTMTPLPRGEMHVLWAQDISQLSSFLNLIEQCLAPQSILVLSLDCDAIKGSEVEAVSAVNHAGLSLETVGAIIGWYKSVCKKRNQKGYFGIYEFNPLYDSVSQKSARAIVHLIWEFLK